MESKYKENFELLTLGVNMDHMHPHPARAADLEPVTVAAVLTGAFLYSCLQIISIRVSESE